MTDRPLLAATSPSCVNIRPTTLTNPSLSRPSRKPCSTSTSSCNPPSSLGRSRRSTRSSGNWMRCKPPSIYPSSRCVSSPLPHPIVLTSRSSHTSFLPSSKMTPTPSTRCSSSTDWRTRRISSVSLSNRPTTSRRASTQSFRRNLSSCARYTPSLVLPEPY